MNKRSIAWLVFAVLAIVCVPFVHADQSRVVRLRDVEGDVTLHPADNQRPEDATVNTPILDGDEIETQQGRAELAFRNGIVVRIGDDSRVRISSAYSPMRIELMEGTLFVDSHLVDSFRDELEVLAGDAQVYLIDEGNMRVDLGTEGSVRVTSIQGEAEVRANGRRVLLENGERTYVDPGSAPEQPEDFNAQLDDLDDWNQSRMEQYADRDRDDDRYLDDDIYYDGSDLDQYGDWRAYGSYGHVWVPNVGSDWRPYYDGRWNYTNGGWFWISYEPWGWAPYHYGRWGWAYDVGWYWIPGDVFAPAWVSWYDYGDYIGWCPLNFYNRPIFYFNYNHFNLPRVQKQKTLDAGNSWTFVPKRDLGNSNVKRVIVPPTEVRKIRIDENKVIRSPQSQLVNYVIPKTLPGRGFVNDKRIVKPTEDIKNPLGVDHRDEQFGRGRGRNETAKGVDKKTLPPSAGSPAVRKNHDEQFGRGTTWGNAPSPRTPQNDDRDSQFERGNAARERQNRSYVSPYYRERDQERDLRTRDNDNDNLREMDPMLWYRQQLERRGKDDDNRDISPRYGDEARRVFERLDQERHDREQRSVNDNNNRPSERESRPEPKREYSKPAPPPPQRHENRGNSGNNGSHGGSKPDHHH